MNSVHERIADARQALLRAGLTVEDARLDAEVLARHALGWDRARLVADGRDPMPADVDREYSALIERRATREPVAFITGRREFWGLDFDVSPDVLIPRPETELIVEAACDRLSRRDAVRTIVDVGTGSGCLAIALAHEFPQARVLATDISAAALGIAAGNARRHRVERRVTFVRGDLLEPVHGPVDLVVSNPPYVPAGVGLSPDIVRFEPPIALYSGHDGLTLVKRLVQSVRACLSDQGLFVVEFGLGQDDEVESLGRAAGWKDVAIKADLQGIPRVAVMTK
jgi:release factor glutamine methyltransferase